MKNTEEERVRVMVLLKRAQHKEVRHIAVDERKTMSGVIRQAIDNLLQKRAAKSPNGKSAE